MSKVLKSDAGTGTRNESRLLFPQLKFFNCKNMATVSKQNILQIHEERSRKDNYNNDHQHRELSNILGGIDNILMMVLSSDNVELNNHQLSQLHQRLISKQIIKESNANGQEIQGQIEYTHCFIQSNTFLHLVFGRNYGQKLFNFIYSPYLIYSIYIGCFITYILHIYFRFFMVSIPLYIIITVWIIFILLSINRKAFKLTIETFTFWIKILYTLRFIIATLIVRYDHFYIASRCIMNFWWVLLYSFIDGLQLPFLFVILLGINFAAHFSWIYIAISLNKTYLPVIDQYIDIDFSRFGLKTSFSLLSMVQGAALILALFFWRAIILKIVHRKSKKCVIIRSTPYYKWSKDATINNNEQQMNQIMNTSFDTNVEDDNDGFIFADGRVINDAQIIDLDQSDKDIENDLSSDSEYLCFNDDQQTV